MSKCLECNGCMQHVWYKEVLHFLYCDFCNKYYILRDKKLIEANPEEEYNKIYGER